MDPIRMWHDLLNGALPEKELFEGLKRIYIENPPSVAEIIMNSYCPNRCRHCIYPPDFHIHNKNMGMEKWKNAFEIIYRELGLRRFIFGGRGLSNSCIEAIRYIKNNMHDVKVGLITDGVSAETFLEDLALLPLDWVDISVDGLEKDHDTQRDSKGAFRKTLRILNELKDSGRYEKVNISTCLTSININTILEMIESLNKEGFKNFVVTPVSIMEGYRPDPELRLSDVKFVEFIDDLIEKAGGFSDTWLEVGIYEAMYANAIKRIKPDLFEEFLMDYEHLELVNMSGDNEVHICYYPSSLTGTREFILNTDGNIIPPKVMTMGEIPGAFAFGNILEAGTDIFREMLDTEAFSFYRSELMEEKALLKGNGTMLKKIEEVNSNGCC